MKRLVLALALLALPLAASAQNYQVRVCHSDFVPTDVYTLTLEQLAPKLACFGIAPRDTNGEVLKYVLLTRACYDDPGIGCLDHPACDIWPPSHPETGLLSCYGPHPDSCHSYAIRNICEQQFIQNWTCAIGSSPGHFGGFGHVYGVTISREDYGPIYCLFAPYRPCR